LGGYAETGTRTGVDVIDGDASTGVQQAFFNQEFQGVVLENLIIDFWLIQSQSQ
jgi:hypothetical protein